MSVNENEQQSSSMTQAGHERMQKGSHVTKLPTAVSVPNIHFSTKRMDWRTPIDFWMRLNEEFQFTWDAAATKQSSLCGPMYYGPDQEIPEYRDALVTTWHPDYVYWMNPPYGRQINLFMAKAHEEACRGCVVVCLVPARTDTAWWHEHAMFADQILLVRGRLKFDEGSNAAPFPSAVVVYRGNEWSKPVAHFEAINAVEKE